MKREQNRLRMLCSCIRTSMLQCIMVIRREENADYNWHQEKPAQLGVVNVVLT